MKLLLMLNVFLFLTFLSCSGLKEVENTEVDIKIIEINSWLNLMPGGPGSFHLSGEFAVSSDTENMIMNLNLKEISVFQKENLLYRFEPVSNYSRTESDLSSNSKRIEIYQFYTEKGLEIRESLLGDNVIKVQLNFDVDDEKIIRILDDVEVTRAY